MASLNLGVVDREGVRTDEPRAATKGGDTLIVVPLLMLLRDRVGERPFEADQLRPIDVYIPGDAVSLHPPLRVDHLDTGNEHLLRVTAS